MAEDTGAGQTGSIRNEVRTRLLIKSSLCSGADLDDDRPVSQLFRIRQQYHSDASS